MLQRLINHTKAVPEYGDRQRLELQPGSLSVE